MADREPGAAFGLRQHRGRVAHLKLARRFNIERADFAVLDQHGVAVAAQTHAAR